MQPLDNCDSTFMSERINQEFHENDVASNMLDTTTVEDNCVDVSENSTVPCDRDRIRKFKPEWQTIFDWLQPVENDVTRALCVTCNSTFTARLHSCYSHSNTFKHMKNSNDTSRIMANFNCSKAASEIKITAFIVYKNLPFLLADDLIPFLQMLAPDSNILKEVSLNRKNVINIIWNVIAPTYRDYMSHVLKSEMFCIMADESTDITNLQSMCMMVRYFDPTTKKNPG